MAEEIPLIPAIPEALREAAQIGGKLVPFVGAGASCLAGCPDWTEFADGCLRAFVDNSKFSHAQLDQITSLSPRVKLSIALALQEEHQIKIDFQRILHPKPKLEHKKGRRLYASLAKLGNTFVTTNYDEWLDEELAAPSTTLSEPADVQTMPNPRAVFYKVSDWHSLGR